MATRGRKPKASTEKPKEAGKPTQEHVAETHKPQQPVKPKIRILESRATPQLSQPQNFAASGNLIVCDRKSGKCTSFASRYANKLVARSNGKLYIKK